MAQNALFEHKAFNAQFEQVAARLASKLQQANKKRVAVAYYTYQGRVNSLGRLVADRVDAGLTNIPQKSFTVVNRKQLEALKKERRLELVGLLRPGSAGLEGGFLGADVVIVGSIVPLSGDFYIISKGIDTDTGSIVFADGEWLVRTQISDELFRTGISGRDIFRNMPISARFATSPTFDIEEGAVLCRGYGVFKSWQYAQAKYCHERPRSTSSSMTCSWFNGGKWEKTRRQNGFCNGTVSPRLLEGLGIDPNEAKANNDS